ncbi:predicted protein [Histoplasma capsulatum var. duboisii H88]|uniref:Predicted protein n=1 Tax=Ajellomyces capsulatus (strain H88) TaxID=544711 RepID=F0UW67_AJEC8|nr:predicted protein [Histoplasma capsulatum var. duboisii H88]
MAVSLEQGCGHPGSLNPRVKQSSITKKQHEALRDHRIKTGEGWISQHHPCTIPAGGEQRRGQVNASARARGRGRAREREREIKKEEGVGKFFIQIRVIQIACSGELIFNTRPQLDTTVLASEFSAKCQKC